MNAIGDDPILVVRGLSKRFTVERDLLGRSTKHVHALNGVDFELARGETLGLVGESGCGKTTAGRVLLRLIEATAGEVLFDSGNVARDGKPAKANVLTAGRREMQALRRDMQIVFQDPYSSLNPRMRVATNIAEPLRANGISRRARSQKVFELLTDVGLSTYHASRYPHELSGGQRQRVAIARALSLDPKFIVADEPVSALDVSIQAQILNLMADLQARRGLAMLFIAHNLAAVRYISQRIAVMYLGRIVEVAPTGMLFERPLHPYTQALIDAVPGLRKSRTALSGEPPSPSAMPAGCPFHPRCQHATDRCLTETPALREIQAGHKAACHHAHELHLPGTHGAQPPGLDGKRRDGDE